MKKEIRQLKDNILTVTTIDERWYARPGTDKTTGLPAMEFLPSVTWIASHYPKGIGFFKWLASKGWDEAEAIKIAAGGKGSKVHHAIVDLLDGKDVTMDAKYVNPTTEQLEELSLAEYECLLAFSDWWRGGGGKKQLRPVQTLGREIVVVNEEIGYMGTVDWYGVMEMPDRTKQVWLLDWKTGQEVWPEYEIQVSAYKHAKPWWIASGDNIGDEIMAKQFEQLVAFDTLKLGILQVGYRKNERGWKLTEVADQYPLFLAAHTIWQSETAGQTPLQRDYPLSIKLAQS